MNPTNYFSRKGHHLYNYAVRNDIFTGRESEKVSRVINYEGGSLVKKLNCETFKKFIRFYINSLNPIFVLGEYSNGGNGLGMCGTFNVRMASIFDFIENNDNNILVSYNYDFLCHFRGKCTVIDPLNIDNVIKRVNIYFENCNVPKVSTFEILHFLKNLNGFWGKKVIPFTRKEYRLDDDFFMFIFNSDLSFDDKTIGDMGTFLKNIHVMSSFFSLKTTQDIIRVCFNKGAKQPMPFVWKLCVFGKQYVCPKNLRYKIDEINESKGKLRSYIFNLPRKVRMKTFSAKFRFFLGRDYKMDPDGAVFRREFDTRQRECNLCIGTQTLLDYTTYEKGKELVKIISKGMLYPLIFYLYWRFGLGLDISQIITPDTLRYLKRLGTSIPKKEVRVNYEKELTAELGHMLKKLSKKRQRCRVAGELLLEPPSKKRKGTWERLCEKKKGGGDG